MLQSFVIDTCGTRISIGEKILAVDNKLQLCNCVYWADGTKIYFPILIYFSFEQLLFLYHIGRFQKISAIFEYKFLKIVIEIHRIIGYSKS